MLTQLSISNFAIIKHLDIHFNPGLNILSGETGTGKSIIINAMNLILGARASSDLIRSGCGEAMVEALFHFPGHPILTENLKDMGVPFDGELLLKRTIFLEGRNRIFINGSLATLQMLARLGGILISISGQHEHQRLLKPENHLYFLDDYGGLTHERQELEGVYERYQKIKDEFGRIEKGIQAIEEKQDLTRFQIQEIDAAAIYEGEDDILVEERRRLQHAEELLEIVTQGYQALYEKPDSALSAVSQCIRKMAKGSEMDARLAPHRETLSDIEARLEDVSFALRDHQKTITMDPQRLEDVEERLDLLNRLKRKYGSSLEDVLVYKEKLASEIYDLDDKIEKKKKLTERLQALESEIMKRSLALSKERQESGKDFEKAVEQELQYLHMGNTRFQVGFEDDLNTKDSRKERGIEAVRPDGFDRVAFMICPNVGEELRPLSKIVSGGELSRIMLAMKTILAKTASVETVIFDEVDAGISGATAEVVGEKLLALSEYCQVLCITHLPQIASQGGTQFLVTKDVIKGRTQTHIRELSVEERVQEIARLLGGKEITQSAVDHAKEMLS